MVTASLFCPAKPFAGFAATSRRSSGRRNQAFTACGSAKQDVPAIQRGSSEAVTLLDRRTLLSAGALYAVTTEVALLTAAAEDGAGNGFSKAPSGLEWKDVREGTGPSPVSGALIRCHYTGKLASTGAVFDSSYGRRPLQFKIGVHQVISGWDQGILGDETIPPMQEGGKRSLRIPPGLGYGARGAGAVIPPNATLLFDVELLGKR